MNPVSPVIPGQESRETIYAKDQPMYLPLPAIVMDGVEREVLTCWELTNEEKIALLSGGQIYLSLWTFGSPLQPIRLRVAMPEDVAEEYGLAPRKHEDYCGYKPDHEGVCAEAVNISHPADQLEKALDEKFPMN